jgi:hypothetical protein
MVKDIILDLDGTLSNESIGDFIEDTGLASDDYEKMKSAIAEFTPKHGVDILSRGGFEPIIVTGRHESLRAVTEVWLHSYNIPFKELIMMPDGSYGNKFDWDKYVDYKVKTHAQYDVWFTLDDNKGIVTVLQNHGYNAYLVGDDFGEVFMEAWSNGIEP